MAISFQRLEEVLPTVNKRVTGTIYAIAKRKYFTVYDFNGKSLWVIKYNNPKQFILLIKILKKNKVKIKFKQKTYQLISLTEFKDLNLNLWSM